MGSNNAKCHPREVELGLLDLQRFSKVLGEDSWSEFETVIKKMVRALDGRRIWNINSTPAGGGVAEMLATLVPYSKSVGADVRWAVTQGETPFFTVTKRLHNFLHGFPGDCGHMDEEARKIYEETVAKDTALLMDTVSDKDIVILHDPQTAGMIPALAARGIPVVWRCHIGTSDRNETMQEGWDFLLRYIQKASACVFTRLAYVPESLSSTPIQIIPPSIDPFSAKNQDLSSGVTDAILLSSGAFQSSKKNTMKPSYIRFSGKVGEVERKVELTSEDGAPDLDTPYVIQVSRWDRLKDPVGVLRGFAGFIAPNTNANLLIAGPDSKAVADDPEGIQVLEEVRHAWRDQPEAIRRRIFLVCIPMDDLEENAVIVNALQRKASLVVQKSLMEGFGLTVSEAMWKSRAVLASKVGGIQDQIIHDESGLLLDPATDLEEYGKLACQVLLDPAKMEALGKKAKERVRGNFLNDRTLVRYSELLEQFL